MTREEIAMVAAREARIVRSPVGGCPVLRFEPARDDVRSEMRWARVLLFLGVGLLGWCGGRVLEWW